VQSRGNSLDAVNAARSTWRTSAFHRHADAPRNEAFAGMRGQPAATPATTAYRARCAPQPGVGSKAYRAWRVSSWKLRFAWPGSATMPAL
jgi:hypothetical protein